MFWFSCSFCQCINHPLTSLEQLRGQRCSTFLTYYHCPVFHITLGQKVKQVWTHVEVRCDYIKYFLYFSVYHKFLHDTRDTVVHEITWVESLIRTAVYSRDEPHPSQNELIIECSLHSRGISIHLERPMKGKSCSKTPGSIHVNKSCWIQPGASSSVHTNISNVHPPSSYHSSIMPSPKCPCPLSLSTIPIWRLLLFS